MIFNVLLLTATTATLNSLSLLAFSSPVHNAIQRRAFLSIGTKGFGGGLAAATSPEEDLELTREIILNHIEKENDMTQKYDDKVDDNLSYPKNDLMIRAALGHEPVERTPTWLFRQAGRHLPEYTEHKKKTGHSFLQMLRYPEDVAECTLQPLRRYDVDAAILFSDILVIAEALNIEVTMPGGVGILIPCPLENPEDMENRLPSFDNVSAADIVSTKLSHVMESVRLIRTKMAEEEISIPLIGFSAAPWTLLFYMVGGSSRRNNYAGMQWLKEHPAASRKLLDRLTDIVIEYMSAQVDNGAHMLQLFEAMGMMIDEENFYEFAMPCLEKIGLTLKERYPDIPLMVFSRGASFANEKLSQLTYDVVTLDGEVPRETARVVVGNRVSLQGNYNPCELIPDKEGTKTPETVRQTVIDMLVAFGPQKLIANLGEGLGGKESTELVKAFVDSVHEESEKLIVSAVM